MFLASTRVRGGTWWLAAAVTLGLGACNGGNADGSDDEMASSTGEDDGGDHPLDDRRRHGRQRREHRRRHRGARRRHRRRRRRWRVSAVGRGLQRRAEVHALVAAARPHPGRAALLSRDGQPQARGRGVQRPGVRRKLRGRLRARNDVRGRQSRHAVRGVPLVLQSLGQRVRSGRHVQAVLRAARRRARGSAVHGSVRPTADGRLHSAGLAVPAGLAHHRGPKWLHLHAAGAGHPQCPLEGCGLANDCQPGLVCIVAERLPSCPFTSCCSPICSLSEGDAPCMDVDPDLDCIDWMSPDPQWQDVGVCALAE